MPKSEHRTAWLLAGTIVVVIALGAIAFGLRQRGQSLSGWLNGDLSWQSILVGMVYGLTFGFIDSLLLLIGVDGLSSVYKRLPGGRSPTMASLYGNTYSSVISGFCSAFVGDIIASHLDADTGPVWGQPIGLFVGCVFIIMVRLSFGKSVSG